MSELERSALLRQIIEEIDVAVLAFDAAGDVKLLNRTALQLLNLPSEQGLNRSATELGLAELLEGEAPRTLKLRIGNGSGPWELRRVRFRQGGLPHTFVVLADLRRALREEERQAWQRLVRVLSHEINNSLAPILSIASGLQELLQAQASAGAWVQDVRDGLAVVERRSAGLSRFMAAYGWTAPTSLFPFSPPSPRVPVLAWCSAGRSPKRTREASRCTMRRADRAATHCCSCPSIRRDE